MAEVLVYVDHVDGAVRKPTLELLTLARRLGEPVAVALGTGAEATASTLAEHGAVKVLTADAPEFADYLVVPKVDALQAAYEAVSPVAVLVPTSAEGKEIAARLAVRIGSGIITDAIDLEAGDEGPVATQSAFAASFTHQVPCVQGHAGHHGQAQLGRPSRQPRPRAPSRRLTVTFRSKATGTRIVSRTPRESTGRPELTEAAIVVSGGRGVNGAENFHAHRGARRRARRCRRRLACRRRRRLVPALPPGRPDRQVGLSAAVHRQRHLRRDPAPRRHADLEDHRGRQQGRRGPDLRSGRLRRRRRPLPGRATTDRRGHFPQGLTRIVSSFTYGPGLRGESPPRAPGRSRQLPGEVPLTKSSARSRVVPSRDPRVMARPGIRTCGRSATGPPQLCARTVRDTVPSDRVSEAGCCGQATGGYGRGGTVLVWVNGAFTAGKTSTARELIDLVPNSTFCDPEVLGGALRFLLPQKRLAEVNDYQDLPIWRRMVVDTAAALLAEVGGVLVVPMTLLRQEYRDEIFGGLAARRVPVWHVLLATEETILRERIAGREASPGDPEGSARLGQWACEPPRVLHCRARLAHRRRPRHRQQRPHSGPCRAADRRGTADRGSRGLRDRADARSRRRDRGSRGPALRRAGPACCSSTRRTSRDGSSPAA